MHYAPKIVTFVYWYNEESYQLVADLLATRQTILTCQCDYVMRMIFKDVYTNFISLITLFLFLPILCRPTIVCGCGLSVTSNKEFEFDTLPTSSQQLGNKSL